MGGVLHEINFSSPENEVLPRGNVIYAGPKSPRNKSYRAPWDEIHFHYVRDAGEMV